MIPPTWRSLLKLPLRWRSRRTERTGSDFSPTHLTELAEGYWLNHTASSPYDFKYVQVRICHLSDKEGDTV